MEEYKVTISLNEYEQLIRSAERVNQALAYIDRCPYGVIKKDIISILTGENVKEEANE